MIEDWNFIPDLQTQVILIGVLKLVEVMLALLVLVCVALSQATSSGVTSSYSIGMGTNIFNSLEPSPFQGVEFERANQLDRRYSQMRAPATYGGVIVSVLIFCGTLGMLVGSVGKKRKDSRAWILADLVFSAICALICIVGLALYLHVIISANATDVCLQRERLYAGRGHTWVNCQVQGTDGAAAFFIVILALLYIASAVVAARKLYKMHKGKTMAYDRSVSSPALFDKPPSYTSTALNDIESDVTLSRYVPPPREGIQPAAAHKPRKCKREEDLCI
uniref:MARVEL domain-containing protein 3-like isoform X2 n=1 Tax=Myxine glutinosa TaxID=7769 RepID=UPI00358EA023